MRIRTQPCEAAVPIELSASVPWMPAPSKMPSQRALSGFSGVPPGTMCFAWAFAGEPVAVFTRTQRFFGERTDVMRQGAQFGLTRLAHYHQRWLRGERA